MKERDISQETFSRSISSRYRPRALALEPPQFAEFVQILEQDPVVHRRIPGGARTPIGDDSEDVPDTNANENGFGAHNVECRVNRAQLVQCDAFALAQRLPFGFRLLQEGREVFYRRSLASAKPVMGSGRFCSHM